MRYDMAKDNLDRHAAHAVAAYLAGMSTGWHRLALPSQPRQPAVFADDRGLRRG